MFRWVIFDNVEVLGFGSHRYAEQPAFAGSEKIPHFVIFDKKTIGNCWFLLWEQVDNVRDYLVIMELLIENLLPNILFGEFFQFRIDQFDCFADVWFSDLFV